MRRTGIVAMALLQAGCATMGRGAYVGYEDEVVDTRSRLVAVPRVLVWMEQDGATLNVTARHECQEVRQELVEREHEWERVNQTPQVTGYLAAGALVLAGTGVLMLATAEPDDPTDDITPEEQRQVGWLGIGLGGALLVVPAVDLIRAAGTEVQTERLERTGAVLRSGIPCPGSTASGQRVNVGDSVLGVTGPDGRVRIDLLATLPRELVVGPERAANVEVGVAGEPRGTIALAPVAAALEERTWAAIDPALCEADPLRNRAHCDSLGRYLEDFPDGAHAAEARTSLAQVREAIRAYEEAERRAAEEARRQAEEEARRRAEEEERRRAEELARWEAEQERAQREAEERRRRAEEEARQARERAEQRRRCESGCRRGCAGSRECTQACVRQRCP